MRPGAGDRLLLCYVPGFDRCEASADSISLIDVAPTLMALVGQRLAPTMRGRSILRRRARAAAPAAAAS